jgi:hypothetical protein
MDTFTGPVRDVHTGEYLGRVVENEDGSVAAYGKRDNYLGTWGNVLSAQTAIEMDKF